MINVTVAMGMIYTDSAEIFLIRKLHHSSISSPWSRPPITTKHHRWLSF
ncbi:unnamed protein product [Acidithrix sp. C25]|nr:unnamed protein product [Acidithrix sp. C25]